jgi:hypothetical protein
MANEEASMNKRSAIVWAGLIVVLPLLVSARQQQSAEAPIPQITKQTTVPPVSQKQIKILESQIEKLKIEVAHLALERH